MTLRPEFSLHHSGFEPFLFAPIWEENDGGSLSILSAFARLGVDPWGESARLAAMPRDKAAAALATILERLPRTDPKPPHDPTLARRLVDLLPEGASATQPKKQADGGGIDVGKAKFPLIIALAAIVALLQASGWLF